MSKQLIVNLYFVWYFTVFVVRTSFPAADTLTAGGTVSPTDWSSLWVGRDEYTSRAKAICDGKEKCNITFPAQRISEPAFGIRTSN